MHISIILVVVVTVMQEWGDRRRIGKTRRMNRRRSGRSRSGRSRGMNNSGF
jgi:hypothetical protein